MRLRRFRIPITRLENIVIDLETIKGEYGYEVIPHPSRNPDLADLMDHKGFMSGPYHDKHADLIQYGLLEYRGKSGSAISELGKEILTARNPSEQRQALGKAAMKVELWSILYMKYELKLPTLEKFAAEVARITGCNLDEVKEHAVFLQDAYDLDTKAIRFSDYPQIEIGVGSHRYSWPVTGKGKKKAEAGVRSRLSRFQKEQRRILLRKKASNHSDA